MRTQPVILAAVALLVASGSAPGQTQTPRGDSPPALSSNPEAHPQSATPDRPPASTMPDANKRSPETTGQTPAMSEKMEPGWTLRAGRRPHPANRRNNRLDFCVRSSISTVHVGGASPVPLGAREAGRQRWPWGAGFGLSLAWLNPREIRAVARC